MITTMAGSTARRKHNVMHLKNNYTSKCTSTLASFLSLSCGSKVIIAQKEGGAWERGYIYISICIYIYNLHLQSTSTTLIYIYNLHLYNNLQFNRMHRPHSLNCARMQTVTITLSLSGCQAWSKASSRREREVTRNR